MGIDHFGSMNENGVVDGGDVVDPDVVSPTSLEWKFSQVFGERTAGEEVQDGRL